MSLSDLETTLNNATKDGALAVTGTLVGSDAVGQLIEDAWPTAKTMTVAAPTVTLSGDKAALSVKGKLDIAEVRAATVDIVFTEPGGTLAMQARVTLASPLKLSDLFKVLGNEALHALTIDNGVIILDTAPFEDPGSGRTLDPGVNLTGTIKPADSYSYLDALINKDAVVALAGPITNIALPLFDFTTKPIDAELLGQPLPGFSLGFAMVKIAELDGAPIAQAEASIAAKLAVGDVTGTVTATLPTDATSLTLLAEFESLNLASFDELAVYIGQTNPLAALPDPVQMQITKVGGAFALKSMTLNVGIQTPAFNEVALAIVIDLQGFEIFHIIPDLAVTELDLNLRVNNTTSPVLVTFGATATIEIDKSYDVLLGFQTQSTGGYQLSVRQAPGSKLELADVLTTFLPDLTEFPTLEVETFSLLIWPDDNRYRFNAVITSDWDVLTTPLVRLSEIDIGASYNKALTPSSSGALKGVFTLKVDDDPENDVLITLAAVKDPGSKGWKLRGASGEDQIVPVGHLVTAIVHQFDATATIPEFIDGLGVENLDLSFDTEDKEFHFGTKILMPFTDDVMLELTVALDVMPIAAASDTASDPLGARSIGGGTALGDPQAATYETKFSGTIQVSRYQFDIVFDDKTNISTTLIADYHPRQGDQQSVSLKELIAGISPSLATDIPLDITIELKDVKFAMVKDPTTKRFAFGLDVGIPITLSDIPIVGNKLPKDLTLGITNLQGDYATKPFDKATITGVNTLLPGGVESFPSEGLKQGVNLTADVQVGSWTEHFVLAGVKPEQSVPPKLGEDGASPRTGRSGTTSPDGGGGDLGVTPAGSSNDSYTWINVNKQIGIFQFDKLGAGYVDNRLSIAIDAAVSLGPLTFTMEGLSAGTPMDAFDPVFGLNGLGLAFKRPPLSISGNFIKVSDPPPTSYYGQVAVNVSKIGFSALGGWSPDANPASFFLYASLNAPLGGPPFLYVTALSGGLGINRTLILPTMDTLPGYILLPNNAPEPEASPSATINKILPQLTTYFIDEPGEYWIAAGVQFTSFEMVNAFVLVTVSFGNEFQIGVLGSASMSLPSGTAKPVAYLEVDIIATFTPSAGLLSVEGRISPQSYIFGGFVKVEGGFAFYVWFDKEYAGDFVITVGGYAPGYDKPLNYPVVPRMKMSFALGPLSVTGTSYFALTPSMLMAGMTLNAVFNAGPVRAWLDAGVHVLIAWAPFHYEAGVYVSIGVSVDLGLFTISLHVGAELEIWGPAFGGRAEVDLDVVSFTISFGAAKEGPKAIGWNNFKTNFLPKSGQTNSQEEAPAAKQALFAVEEGTASESEQSNIIKVQIPDGLVTTAVPGYDGIVTPNGFKFDVSTTVPANAACWTIARNESVDLPNTVADWSHPDPTPGQPFLQLQPKQETFSDTEVWNPTIDIGPMGKKDIGSKIKVSVFKHTDQDKSGEYSDVITDLTVNPRLTPSNTALWKDQEVGTDPNLPRFLRETLVGIEISPIPRKPNRVSAVPLIELLFAGGNNTGFYPGKAAVVAGYTVTSVLSNKGGSPVKPGIEPNKLTITVGGKHDAVLINTDWYLSALNDAWVSDQRGDLADALREAGFKTFRSDQIDLAEMATQKTMTDWPTVRQLGA